ncbi:MAG: hypothetical protein ACOVLC_01245 [Flavobacterium sp.]
MRSALANVSRLPYLKTTTTGVWLNSRLICRVISAKSERLGLSLETSTPNNKIPAYLSDFKSAWVILVSSLLKIASVTIPKG